MRHLLNHGSFAAAALLAAGLLLGCAADAGSGDTTKTHSSALAGAYELQVGRGKAADLRPVDFEKADDNTEELDALVNRANETLPYYMSVTATDFAYVQSEAHDPTLRQVQESYLAAYRLDRVTIAPDPSRAQLDADLRTYELTGAVEAAQHAVGATEFQLGLAKFEGLVGPGVTGWTSYYTLYFPSVNRFVVIVLDAYEV